MATKDVGGREMRTGEKGEWNKNKGRQMIVEEENDTESDMGRGGEKERRKKAAGQEREKDIRREPAPGCGGRGRGGEAGRRTGNFPSCKFLTSYFPTASKSSSLSSWMFSERAFV